MHLKLDIVVAASPRRPGDGHVTFVSVAAARQPEAALRVAASVKVNAEVIVSSGVILIMKSLLKVGDTGLLKIRRWFSRCMPPDKQLIHE